MRIVVSGVRISWSRLAANSRSRCDRLVDAVAEAVEGLHQHAGLVGGAGWPASGSSGAERAMLRVAATIGPTAIAATARAISTAAATQISQSAEQRVAEVVDARLGGGGVEHDAQAAVFGIDDGDVQQTWPVAARS